MLSPVSLVMEGVVQINYATLRLMTTVIHSLIMSYVPHMWSVDKYKVSFYE